MRRLAALGVAVCIAAARWPISGWADAAPAWQPGDAIGEPTGSVKHVAITHEDLVFDLRPLADAKPVLVHATYELRNDEATTTAPLVFLADHALTETSTFAVRFDDAPVAALPTTLTQLPDAWKPPVSTPSLFGDGTAIPYQLRPGTAFQFTVVIPPAQHRLSVAYQVQPGRNAFPGVTTIWQVAYVLAPARQWASFGDLLIQAQLPAGWRARALPSLSRRGDTLEGHFAGLPGDSLVMSASYPVDPHLMSIPEWAASQWPLILGLFVITALGAAAVPQFTGQRWVFILCGLMWALPAAGRWMATAYVTPPDTQYSAGKCGMVTVGFLVLPGALAIAVIAAGVGVLAVVIPMFLGAALWARWRRPA